MFYDGLPYRPLVVQLNGIDGPTLCRAMQCSLTASKTSAWIEIANVYEEDFTKLIPVNNVLPYSK